jgi:hypothetical protein
MRGLKRKWFPLRTNYCAELIMNQCDKKEMAQKHEKTFLRLPKKESYTRNGISQFWHLIGINDIQNIRLPGVLSDAGTNCFRTRKMSVMIRSSM